MDPRIFYRLQSSTCGDPEIRLHEVVPFWRKHDLGRRLAQILEYEGSSLSRLHRFTSTLWLFGKDPDAERPGYSHLESERYSASRHQFSRPRNASPIRIQEIRSDVELRKPLSKALLP